MLGDYAYGSYFIFFFLFFFLLPSAVCIFIFFYKFFFFPLNILSLLNGRTCVFTVPRIHGISRVAWLLPSYPYMLVSLIHEKSYRWWFHSSNGDIFFFFFLFFLSLQKIQDRRSPIQFSTWIKKTVHVSRPFFFFFFFLPLFPHFQTLSNELFLSVTLVAGYSLFSALLETKRKRNWLRQW